MRLHCGNRPSRCAPTRTRNLLLTPPITCSRRRHILRSSLWTSTSILAEHGRGRHVLMQTYTIYFELMCGECSSNLPSMASLLCACHHDIQGSDIRVTNAQDRREKERLLTELDRSACGAAGCRRRS